MAAFAGVTEVSPAPRARLHTLAAAWYATVAAVFCRPVLTGHTWSVVPGHQNGQYPWRAFRTALRASTQTDQATLYYPWLTLLERAREADVLPWWNPGSFGGQPLISNGQLGFAYPPRVLLTALVSPPVVHDTLLVLHLLLAGVCAYALLRDLGRGWLGALFGGTAWMLSSFATGWLQMQVVTPVVYFLPLLLLVARRVVLRPSVASTRTAAGVIALAIVSGSMAFLGMAVVVAGLYGLCLAARTSWTAAGRVALAFGLGLGFAAFVLVPTMLTAATSTRDALGAVTVDEAYLAPPSTIRYAFRPPPVEGNRLLLRQLAFTGTATVALAFAGLFRRAPGAGLGRALAILSPLVAFGGPLTVIALHAVPPLREFRPLGRLYLFFGLGVVLLAALGIDLLLRGWRRAPRAAAAVVLAITAVTAVELGAFGRHANPDFAPRTAANLFPDTPLVHALRDDRPRGGRTPRVALVDPSRLDGRFRPPALTAAIPLALGLSSASGEDSIVPARTQALWKLAMGLPFDQATASLRAGFVARFPSHSVRVDLLERLGVTVIAGGPNLLHDPYWRPDPRRLPLLYSGPDGVAYEVTAPEAATRLVYAADVVDEPDVALRVFTMPAYDAARRVVLERSELRRLRGVPLPAPGGRGRVLAAHERWNTFVATVETDRPALLVVPSMWDAGWSARVGGRRVPVLRGNYHQRVVPVPAGTSEVVLRYRPAGLGAGLAVTAATTAGCAVWAVLDRNRRRAGARHNDDAHRRASA